MSKIIYFNQTQYNTGLVILNDLLEKSQAIIDKFNSLETEEFKVGKFQNDDFEKLLFSTESYLFDKIMEDRPLTVMGTKFTKDKMYSMMWIPNSVPELKKLIGILTGNLERLAKREDVHLSPKDMVRQLEFSESTGKLQIKQDVIDELKVKNEVYANRERTEIVFDFATKLAELINDADQFIEVRIGGGMLDFNRFVGSIIDINPQSHKATVKLHGVKWFDENN